jgi:hypothetical protein
MYQWDFILNWNILPPFDRFQVSGNLMLEVIEPKNVPIDVYYYTEFRPHEITLAYVGIEDKKNNIKKAYSIIELFLLTCALISDFTGTYRGGAGIKIHSLNELGKRRALYHQYKTRGFYSSNLKAVQKPITLVKNRFLQLASDIYEILNGYLGMALRYYSYAVQSSKRGRQSRIEDVIINLAISAETLFTNEPSYTEKLKHRFSFFLAKNELEKTRIIKKVGEFYDYRADIVQGRRRKREMPIEEIKMVKRYIKTAINKALYLKLYKKDELLAYLY